MTSWYAPDEKDGWHWLAIAISTACSIGLHRDPGRTHLNGSQQKLCKRVWWCLVIRDRVIALGQRKPTCIKLEESDVPLLTLEDYEPFNSLSPLDSEDDLRTSAILHMEFAKLSLCVGKVLTTQYSVHPAVSSSQKRGLVPNVTAHSLLRVKDCHVELEAWYQQLPSKAQIADTQSASPPLQRHRNIFLNRTLIHLVYYATLSALHRPQMLPNTIHNNVDIDFSIHQVYSAAASITSLAKSLLDCELMPHVPTYGSTVLLPAMTKHLVDLRSFNVTNKSPTSTDHTDEARKQSLQGFAYCIRAMRHLQQNYTCADVSMALIEAAVQRAGIKIGLAGGHEFVATCVDDLMSQACAQDLVACYQPLTPPEDDEETFNGCAEPTGMGMDGIPSFTTPDMSQEDSAANAQHNHALSFLAHLQQQTTTPPHSENGSNMHAYEYMPTTEAGQIGLASDMHNAFSMATTAGTTAASIAPTDANIEHELQAFLNFDVAGFDLGDEFGGSSGIGGGSVKHDFPDFEIQGHGDSLDVKSTHSLADEQGVHMHTLDEKIAGADADNDVIASVDVDVDVDIETNAEREEEHAQDQHQDQDQDDTFTMQDVVAMPHDFEDLFEDR